MIEFISPGVGHAVSEDLAAVQPMTGDGTIQFTETAEDVVTAAAATISGSINIGASDGVTVSGGDVILSGSPGVISGAGSISWSAAPVWNTYSTMNAGNTWDFSIGNGSFAPNKTKVKPNPIENPVMITRRVLNFAEEGWVVK